MTQISAIFLGVGMSPFGILAFGEDDPEDQTIRNCIPFVNWRVGKCHYGRGDILFESEPSNNGLGQMLHVAI